jgi:hypothetical protein
MTQLLQQALDAVNRLDPAEQDAIAALILEELAEAETEQRLPPGEGIRRSAGGWDDDPEGLDDYLRQIRKLRDESRPPIEP